MKKCIFIIFVLLSLYHCTYDKMVSTGEQGYPHSAYNQKLLSEAIDKAAGDIFANLKQNTELSKIKEYNLEVIQIYPSSMLDSELLKAKVKYILESFSLKETKKESPFKVNLLVKVYGFNTSSERCLYLNLNTYQTAIVEGEFILLNNDKIIAYTRFAGESTKVF